MGSLANLQELHFIIVYIIFCSLHICDNCIIKYININNLYLSISQIFLMSPSLGRLEFMDVLKKKMFMSICVFHSAQFFFYHIFNIDIIIFNFLSNKLVKTYNTKYHILRMLKYISR